MVLYGLLVGNLGLGGQIPRPTRVFSFALKCSLRIDPLSIRAWCNYGITCHQLERFDQAIKAY